LHGFEQIMSWITGLKSTHDLQVSRIPLRAVRDWENDGAAIRHRSGRYFTVIGVDVQIDSREVIRWDQPMIQPAQEGLVAFLTKKIDGIHHFLVQAKLEPGNMDIIELAPTVQCLTGNYRKGQNEYSVPFINDVLAAEPDGTWYSALQSEEGGRFYREQNRNMIVEVGDDFGVEVPDHYCWMTLHQLRTLILFNNFLNIAARSLIAAVAF
jgi:oxidase EvaA